MERHDVRICGFCKGTGSDFFTGKDCEDCKGTGFLIYMSEDVNSISIDEYCRRVRTALDSKSL